MTKITLLYPPQQSHPEHSHKPEASLAYPYLAGALLEAGHDVRIYDACVGNSQDPIDTFYTYTELESGLRRYGVPDDRILEEVADSNVVGITSIFTAQETVALNTCRLVKKQFPKKLLITGGTNARSRWKVFLGAGFDVVCMSEAERAIADIVSHPASTNRLVNQSIITDLDNLPMPAWHLHPNERYWSIGRPHGAPKGESGVFRYAPLMTSRGCVFSCKYCHISGEHSESFGGINRFRVKSLSRVRLEMEQLRSLEVTDLFIEDDTLFGHKKRGIRLLKEISAFGFRLWDINGINIPHFFSRRAGGQYVPDTRLLDVLEECRFSAVSLPVESASQRIINYYSSGKWSIKKHDVTSLIRALSSRGISAGVNYMIGYPDETLTEIKATIDMAQEHMDAGASSANFMLVIPLPGTDLHQQAISQGHLDADFNPDTFNWRQATMKNTVVPPRQLEEIHQAAYEKVNSHESLNLHSSPQ